MLYNTTNGRAHNNSTTNLPHRNARAQHLDMSRCWGAPVRQIFGDFVVQQVVELSRARPLVVSVAGVRVVEFDTYGLCSRDAAESISSTLLIWSALLNSLSQTQCHRKVAVRLLRSEYRRAAFHETGRNKKTCRRRLATYHAAVLLVVLSAVYSQRLRRWR